MPQFTYPLYLDHHATTPVDPRVLEVMLPFFTEHFGNAESSQHAYGWKAKAAVENAREKVSQLIGANAQEILFTSGATESIHLAILGFLARPAEATKQVSGSEHTAPTKLASDSDHADIDRRRAHIITSNAEHKCVLEVCAHAEALGHDVTILPVNRFGQVTPEQVEAALKPHTALVSLIHGNNEIGSLNPISEIGAMLAKRGVVFHVDAAQSVGKVPIDVEAMGIGLLSISGHKFYGPKGVGALYVRRKPGQRVHLAPYLMGGGQERGLRGGTHNVPGIVGIGRAAELCTELMRDESARLTRLRDRVIREVGERLGERPGEGQVEHQSQRIDSPRVELNGHPSERLPNNVSLTFHGISFDTLHQGLSAIACSSSSACGSGTASHVLKAIGQKANDPLSATIRLGLGRTTTEADIDFVIGRILETALQI